MGGGGGGYSHEKYPDRSVRRRQLAATDSCASTGFALTGSFRYFTGQNQHILEEKYWQLVRHTGCYFYLTDSQNKTNKQTKHMCVCVCV